MDLKEKVKNLPITPGVYLMKDTHNHIIYVGKAKNLKRRVGSYFQNSKAHPQKIKKLVSNIKDFNYILTDTEFEAFLLECQLIQEIKPHFNRKMKTPQAYSYIIFQKNADRWKVDVTNTPDHSGTLCFGPFINKNTLERALQGIKEAFKIDCCSPPKKNSPCLNYSLGQCIGVCLGDSAAIDQYNDIIEKIIAMLHGSDTSLLEDMEKKMLAAAEDLDFETAAKYKNNLVSINFLINKEKVIEFAEENKNIAIIEYLNDHTFKLFLIKGNKVLFSEKYNLGSQNPEHTLNAIKTGILTNFKPIGNNSIIINKDEIDEAQIIYSYLKSSACSYKEIPCEWLTSADFTHLDAAIKQLIQFKQRTPGYNELHPNC